MRKTLVSFTVAIVTALMPFCLLGASEVSLAQVMVEKGYTPLTMERAGNEFYVSCKLDGRPASLIVDTGAGRTVVGSGMLRSLGVPLTKAQENVYGVMGLAGKSKAGEIKDIQIGPYQAGAHRVWAWDFSYWGAGGRGMDGLLGIDFLHRHQAVIDCFRMHLFFKSPSAPSASATLSAGLRAGGCTEIPIQATRQGLTVPTRINGRAGYLILDTGAALTTLSQQAIVGLNMRLVSATRFNVRLGAQDVGRNVSVINKAHFTTMNVGNFGVPPQWVGVADLPRANSSKADNLFFGYLGHDLLACYVGIIDCGALKLFLRFDPVIDATRRRKGG